MSQAIKAFYSTYSFPIFHPAVWINQTSKQVFGYFNLSKQASLIQTNKTGSQPYSDTSLLEVSEYSLD